MGENPLNLVDPLDMGHRFHFCPNKKKNIKEALFSAEKGHLQSIFDAYPPTYAAFYYFFTLSENNKYKGQTIIQYF